MAVARILIADDEPEICDMLKGWLSPWTVETAQDGQEALRLLCKQPFDLVILDIKMPYLGGLEVFRAIQEQAIEVDVVFLTGYGTVSTAVKALKMGAQDFLEKPIKRAVFTELVHKLIGRRHSSSHVLADRLDVLLREFSVQPDLKLQDLCEALRISTRYASRLFRDHIGASFRQRLAHYRVRREKQLLERTDEPLYLIAEKCGFRNYHRLTETFRRLEGMPPGAYRKIKFR